MTFLENRQIIEDALVVIVCICFFYLPILATLIERVCDWMKFKCIFFQKRNQNIPTVYTNSFLIFWAATFAAGIYGSGLIGIPFVLAALIIVICHERAHAKAALKSGATVLEMRYTWLGGYVVADLSDYPSDAVEFFKAGVINTGYFAAFFILLNSGINYYVRDVILGFNAAGNPWLSLLNSLALLGSLMFILNILPIRYYIKEKDMLITTDGWAAMIYRERRDELWNDGKARADAIPFYSYI